MNHKLVLYGAGKRGRKWYDFLKNYNCSDIIFGFCDKDGAKIGWIEDKKVYTFDELKNEKVKYCIAIADQKAYQEIEDKIGKENCIDFFGIADFLHKDRVEFNREFCAFSHMDYMDSYFEKAESKNFLDIYWKMDGIFYPLFQTLDLSNVIELACGHGRHVPHYSNKAENITLVDILQKNIDICKMRFNNISKIKFYKNDGYDLKKLSSDTYSSLFTYDAMVHFELIDIYFYLRDIYRVLVGGGRALLHHSNFSENYKAVFNAPHGRRFMSKECFAYLSCSAGFTVLEQKVIDWGGKAELDCVTLLEKPLR